MNNNEGITGIAPNVNLLIIKAECDEYGSFYNTSDLVFGLYYAIERDVNVVNMSFSVHPYTLGEATGLAVDSDIICVAAAGNKSTAALTYPAADPNVIGVGALDDDSFELASYSNYGENVDVVAPGTVYTTKNDGTYQTISGTSFSSPIVAAIIALQSSRDGYSYREFSKKTELLYASCKDLGELGNDFYYGYGAIDVSAFILEDRKTITFNYLTDEIEETEQVFIKGHNLQNIPEPERLYSVFDGWFYDIHCCEEYNLYCDIWQDNITLYCKWANEDDAVPFTYVILDDNTIEIRSYTGKRRYITIPEYIDGLPVSTIGAGAFLNESRLRIINLPSSLTTIKDKAFSGCTNLTSIDIPDNVVNIGKEAFKDNIRLYNVNFNSNSKLEVIESFAFLNCSSLSRFDIPRNVIYNEGWDYGTGSAFRGCVSLKQINAHKESPYYNSLNGILFNKVKSTLVLYPAGLKQDSYELFNDITKLGIYSFANSSIKTIDLNNVTTIGKYAFEMSQINEIEKVESVMRDVYKKFGLHPTFSVDTY